MLKGLKGEAAVPLSSVLKQSVKRKMKLEAQLEQLCETVADLEQAAAEQQCRVKSYLVGEASVH